ncbi:M13 family metallopeptidase [bacterium]|nr:M13 family metallopeptidase [bacterium]
MYFKRFLPLAAILIIMALLAGCGAKPEPALQLANMDTSIKPGNDFFRFVNGTYLKDLTIPDDKTSYNVFNILRERQNVDINALLTEISKSNAEDGTIDQKIRDFYNTGMNVDHIDALGAKPIKADLDAIEALKDKDAMMDLVADMHMRGMSPFFGGGVMQDLANSSQYAFYLAQSGLGLPDVENYTKKDKHTIEIQQTYVKHMAHMFELLGDDAETAHANAKVVMEIETKLAKESKTNLEMRDIRGLYNPYSLKKLQKTVKAINWTAYFKNIGGMEEEKVIVMAPKFYKALDKVIKKTCLCDLQTYMRWNLVNNSASMLSNEFVKTDYDFYSAYLSGSQAMQARWKRITQTVSGMLGEPLGQLYVRKHFPPESKTRMLELVANLRKGLHQRIENVTWMTEDTRKAALAKLATMKVKIGYPDKWKDYSTLEISNDNYVNNIWQAFIFNHNRDLAKLGKPSDPDEWGMSPQTVNAGYNPVLNDITFPAGILQPPYFNPDADDAVNYGAIGVVIGHEMTHGFDDQGRNFDLNGNMRNWWTENDVEEFTKRTKLLVDQYDRFVAIDDVHISGELTLGENIADFGGLTVSLTAYNMAKGDKLVADNEGFTDLQRFFLSYGAIWRGKIRDKALIRKCREDVHPWGEFRVNGAPFNVPEFYEAFDISPEDKLYIAPENRPVIW